MPQSAHWTAESNDAFLHKISFDFIAQLEKKMDALPLSQAALAKKLGVSEGAVSRILNNPQNLTLKTIVAYGRALGVKVSVLAYDDGDPHNERGPIDSEIFSACWKNSGSPRNFWDLKETKSAATTNLLVVSHHGAWAPVAGVVSTQWHYAANLAGILDTNVIVHDVQAVFHGAGQAQLHTGSS